MERRLARMRAQLRQGGEIAQGVLLELFPGGFWLYPDPDGGGYLWAVTQTALTSEWRTSGRRRVPARATLAPRLQRRRSGDGRG
jgi:hypothetical protein